MKALIVVDMQNDFIDGVLGTPEACAIVENVAKKIETTDADIIIATRDSHGPNYMTTQEGSKLPVPHCIMGSDGWEICDRVKDALADEATVVDKPTFGSVAMAGELREFPNLREIELVGVCTDICVISNAMLLKAYMPEVRIAVDSSCCAGVTEESHRVALDAMRACQIEIR